MYNILVCDDEKDIVSALRIYLTAEGYRVFEAGNGAEALEVIDREDIHLALLDVMMPGMDGITALNRLREHHNLPVILLTAKSEDTDKVLGLNVGADDYVTKPFNPVELLARVGAVTIDDDAKRVTVDGEPVSLTPREYDILKFLMQHAGKVFSPQEIYRRVWREVPGSDNPVAVHVRHIREKIEINPAEPCYLTVVWGKGYKVEAANG